MNMVRYKEKSKIYSVRRVSSDILHLCLLSVYVFFIRHPACINGYYGTNCFRVCSPNCKPDQVDTQTENVFVLRVGRVIIVPMVGH